MLKSYLGALFAPDTVTHGYGLQFPFTGPKGDQLACSLPPSTCSIYGTEGYLQEL